MNPDPMQSIQAELARRIAASVDHNISLFITKIEGGLPPADVIAQHGHMVVMQDAKGTEWSRFFIRKKHDVLAMRFGAPEDLPGVSEMEARCALFFCHLFPDDWPEALANHIAELP